MDEKHLEPLARKLFAAYMSNRLGIGLDYAYKRYAKEGAEVGPFWIELAELTEAAMLANMNERFRRIIPEPAPGIQ